MIAAPRSKTTEIGLPHTGTNKMHKTAITHRTICFLDIIKPPLHFLGGISNDGHRKLIEIVSTFTADQMTDFVTAAQDLIKRLQAEGSLGKEK